MDAEDPKRRLRGAVYRGDAAAILAELSQAEAGECLELGGDGLLLALDQEAAGAAATARSWIVALHDRAWEGDAELAEQLAARLGTGAARQLQPLAVDLLELSDVLEGDPRESGGRLDLRTGQVWPQFALDSEDGFDEDEDEDEDRSLEVWSRGSRHGYRDMQDFLDTITDPDRRDRLEIALEGRGAFRRFRDVLARWPAEFTRWNAFSEERRLGRARAWLADAGYRTVPRGGRTAP